MIDIFHPQVSEVVGGLEGKLLLIYGTNRTGKTWNATKAEKPFVIAFERGLNGIAGIPFAPISKWQDWIDVVKALTGPQMEEAKKLYKTIIVDTIDCMGDMCAESVANRYGVRSVGEGKGGYGLWREYSAELAKWLRFLVNSGYTVIFIGHDSLRERSNSDGTKYMQAYPFGEKRVVEPIVNMCDIIGYAYPMPATETGEEVKSTLLLHQNPAYHAGSRFTQLVPLIPEWDMEKLEKAIGDAVAAQEKITGRKATTFAQMQKSVEETVKSPWADLEFDAVKQLALEKAGALMERNGGDPTEYQELLFKELSTKEFSLTNAIPQQRDTVEQILKALLEVLGK